MTDDDELYAQWLDASRRAKQPQCHYPQLDTLRAFAHAIWEEGFLDGANRPPVNPY